MTTIEGKVIAVSSPIPYSYMEINDEVQILSYIKIVVLANRLYSLTFYSGSDNSVNRKAKDPMNLPSFILASFTNIGDEVEISFFTSLLNAENIISMKNLTKNMETNG